MAMADNLHSRVVGWTKIVLPLLAIALLSTLFLFARNATGPSEIPVAEITEIAREQRISAPNFAGIAADGSIIEISAKFAQPQEGSLDQLVITSPSLTIDALDGTKLRIFAGQGVIDGVGQTARLTGLARLETSSGYMMETDALSADLATGQVISDGRLAVIAPFGTLEAGRIEIVVPSNEIGQQMHFTNGVRMLYKPQPNQ